MKNIIATILILIAAPAYAGFMGGVDKNKVNLTTDQTVCGNKTFCSDQTIFNGKIGVSTTAIPTEALVVEGNGIITGNLNVGTVNGVPVSSATLPGLIGRVDALDVATATLRTDVDTKVNRAGDIMTGDLTVPNLIIPEGGKIGLGTNAPDVAFYVRNGSATIENNLKVLGNYYTDGNIYMGHEDRGIWWHHSGNPEGIYDRIVDFTTGHDVAYGSANINRHIFTAGGSDILRLENGGGGGDVGILVGDLYFTGTGKSIKSNVGYELPFLTLHDLNVVELGSTNVNYIKATTGGAERLRIANNGNIGINASDPAYKLDVNGDAHFTSSMTVDGGYYGDGTNLSLGWERIVNPCGPATTCSATCSVGKKLIGGGCSTGNSTTLNDSGPTSDAVYTCNTGVTVNLTATALCLKTQ